MRACVSVTVCVWAVVHCGRVSVAGGVCTVCVCSVVSLECEINERNESFTTYVISSN